MRAMPICGSRRVAALAMRPQRRLAFSQSAALGSRPVQICQGRGPCESVRRRRVILRAEPSTQGDKGPDESANDFQVVKQEGFLGGLMKRLRDFGFGKKSIWEGGVGLFILAGIGLGFGLATWARGARFNSANGYRMTIEFPEACGMTVGTPVRVRGVQVGSVLTVRPHLDKVEALVEVLDANTVIPKNSEILANQSGLIAEPLVDITPKTPIPSYQATPVEPECEAEGVIVCENGRIAGQRGVALDDLVYICTQLARQMDGQGGMDMMFDTARVVSATVEEARPLLTKAAALLDEVNPLLADIRGSSLVQVGNMEALTKTAADAAADIQKLQGALLDDENTKALRQSHIAGDVGVMTGDSKVRANLKQLIDALSRLIDD